MTAMLEGPKTMETGDAVVALGGHREAWQAKLVRRLGLTDLVIVAASVLVAQVWKFGFHADAASTGPLSMNYQSLGAAITIVWWLGLTIGGARDPRLLGDGTAEYVRIARISFVVFGVIAVVSLLFKWDLSRGYLAIAFPLGVVGLLIGRKVWRLALHRSRRDGHALTHSLVVGRPASAVRISRNFEASPASGHRVVGVLDPQGTGPAGSITTAAGEVPVFHDTASLLDAAVSVNADSVIVASAEALGADGLRELAWQLNAAGVELMVSPHLVDVAGTRMHLRPLGNEPYIHLAEPQYAAAGQWPKRLLDALGSGTLLLLCSPILLVTAAAIVLTSRGGVFYRQERIGLDGRTFGMIKFRSMRADADAQLKQLMAEHAGGDVALFKIADDPRVTTVGRFIRRFSIDELPQLINVFKGDMSLVGPRPQRDHEVALYDHVAHRRLTVRPGMTGLWQVSGRSDLSWEDAIRLDNYYVENWSLMGDLIILSRTVRAVLRSDGAY